MKQTKLNTDSLPEEQPEGSYPYGKNCVHINGDGAIENEKGFLSVAGVVVPYQLNGVIETDKFPVLFSTDNTNSAIGYFDTDNLVYIPIVDDNASSPVNWPDPTERLGFSQDFYITGEAQRNYKSQIVIAFTDKNTVPKYLNCDVPNISRAADLRLFPFYKDPVIDLGESLGGSLSFGSYYVAVSYEKYDGTETGKSEVSQGITIAPGTTGGATDKAILITITNADTNYDNIRVYVISITNGITKAYLLSDVLPVSSGSIDLLYTGANIAEEISVTDIITPAAIYSKVGTLGQLNDSLYAAVLTKEDEINDMQPYANMVEIHWKSDLITPNNPPPDHVNGKIKSFMHEEVYAIYIRYHKVQGGFTKAFLCVGQPLGGGEADPSAIASDGGYTDPVEVFRVEDTIRTVSGLTGIPGTWLNATEFYPNTSDYDSSGLGGEDLRGTAVRHHKMPSIRWCKGNLYSGNDDYGRKQLDLLSIYAENVTIPSQYTDVIDGYQLLFAKRSSNNSIVQGQSLLLNGCVDNYQALYDSTAATIYTSGGNWLTSVWHQSAGDYDDNYELTSIRFNTFRLHAFDLLFTKPAIAPSMISGQLKLRTGVGYYEDGQITAGNYDGPQLLLSDFIDAAVPPTQKTGDYLRAFQTRFYTAIGTNVLNFNNIAHEACYAGIFAGPDSGWEITPGTCGYRIRGQSYTEAAVGNPGAEETHLVNLLTVKEDLYSSFYTQSLVAAGPYRALADDSPFTSGDTFLCPYTYHTYGRHDAVDTFGDGIRGIKVVRRYICESIANIHLRYEVLGNLYSQYWPKSPLTVNAALANYITNFQRTVEPNQFGYSRDLNALNTFNSSEIFNPFREIILGFPFRIHRLGKLSRQTAFRNWRTALPLDYYECQKNMGAIVNVDSMNDRLLIHHEKSLFMTQDKAKLESGILSVTLGAGDIFQFEPQMPVDTKLGYAGTQHELGCVKIPPGYMFVDANAGSVFIYSDGKLEDIGTGMLNFLFDTLKVPDVNTYVGNGITIGWDGENDRILMTIKNFIPKGGGHDASDHSFTLSYSMKTKAWAFFHSYFPGMYIHTRDRLFNAKDSQIYQNNEGPRGTYYGGVTKSSFIDVLFRGETDMIADTINWKTEFTDATPANQLFGTLTSVAIWNSHQHSGPITLNQNTALVNKQIRRTMGEWSLNDFRNCIATKGTQFLDTLFTDYAPLGIVNTIPWYRKELMNDKWFCVRFEFDNLTDVRLVIHDTSIQAVTSPR